MGIDRLPLVFADLITTYIPRPLDLVPLASSSALKRLLLTSGSLYRYTPGRGRVCYDLHA